MSALTEIMHDLFAPRLDKVTLGDKMMAVGCAVAIAAMFIVTIAPWLIGAWHILQWVAQIGGENGTD